MSDSPDSAPALFSAENANNLECEMTNAEWLKEKNHSFKLIPSLILACALIFLFSFISCGSQINEHKGFLIAVSIPPQAWFVSQIAGDNAQTLILVPPGQNPHNYEPAPLQIQKLSAADAWILSGSEFEISLRPKIEKLFPNLLIIDGTQGVHFRQLENHHHDGFNNHDEAEGINSNSSSLVNLDRHTWLGREPAYILAAHVTNTLAFLDNENELYYRGRYGRVINIIYDAFNDLKSILAPLNDKSVFVYHPSFGYFLDEFGIHQEAVETGGKEPTPRQLYRLMNMINEEKPAAIFVQTQFPVNAARTLAASAGAQVVELDPLAENWLENILHIGQVLKNIIP